MVFANRAVTIMVIITIAILASRHRTLIDNINEERNTYIKELEEMLFMTSHRVRKPISTCLGLMNLAENDKPFTQEEVAKILKISADSVKNLTQQDHTLRYFLVKGKMRIREEDLREFVERQLKPTHYDNVLP